MKKEIRVYLVDWIETTIPNTELEPQSEYFNEEKFMDEAEKQGSVYTLTGFRDALNKGLCMDSYIVYFKEVEYND